MEPTVDEAVAVLVAEAVSHEQEHGSECCDAVRAALVVTVMMALGMELYSLGEIAEQLADALSEVDAPEPQPDDQWPNTIQSD